MHEKLIILDFGSQTTQLIGRRVRELNMYCEIVPYQIPPRCYRCKRRNPFQESLFRI